MKDVSPLLQEIFTGRLRPRHARFSNGLSRLVGEDGLEVVSGQNSKLQRAAINLQCRTLGYRTRQIDSALPCVLHQALNRGTAAYIAEFDVPLGIHNYNVLWHRRSAHTVRGILEDPRLQAVIVFSEWAKRSFDLHFGPKTGAKCRVLYPLAYERACAGAMADRPFDFCFISTQFEIKCGPQLARAFREARRLTGHSARLCMVTNLAEASRLLGNLDAFAGIEWREARLNEQEIADLLASTRCLVHPALAESFGVVVLEALAAGCALITTDIASFPEMVAPEENGYLLQPPLSAVVGDAYITEYGDAIYFANYLRTLSLHDVENRLIDLLTELLRNPSRVESMMCASNRLYQARFAPSVWADAMADILMDAFPDSSLQSFLQSQSCLHRKPLAI